MNLSRSELIRQDCTLSLGKEAESLQALRKGTVAITGATGFVGTWLAEMIACLNDQHGFEIKTYLISRHTLSFKDRLPHLSNRNDFTLINSDVRDMTDFPRETNWVIHAAANPDSRFHSSSPLETMSIIAEGTASAIRSLDRIANVRMFLNISSSAVYGPQPFDLPAIPEEFSGAPLCSSASSVYSEAKRFAETFCAAARSQAQLPTITVRPFAFVGPFHAMDTPWAINNFIRDALQGNPIRVFGDGQTVRSYMYGADLAFWLLSILSRGTSGQTFNVGGAEPITLADLAKLIAARVNPSPEIRFNTSAFKLSQNSRLVPDVSAAVECFGLKARFDVEKAIDRTILWNKSR